MTKKNKILITNKISLSHIIVDTIYENSKEKHVKAKKAVLNKKIQYIKIWYDGFLLSRFRIKISELMENSALFYVTITLLTSVTDQLTAWKYDVILFFDLVWSKAEREEHELNFRIPGSIKFLSIAISLIVFAALSRKIMKNYGQFDKHSDESGLGGYARITSKIGSIDFLKLFYSVGKLWMCLLRLPEWNSGFLETRLLTV